MPPQPRSRLTTVIHSPTRLAILGALRQIDQIDFSELRSALDLTTSELSRQLGILEKEDLVQIAKLRQRRHAVTRVRLSPQGRERFENYLADLRKVVHSHLD